MALALARFIRTLAGLIALLIVVAIVLFLVGANPANAIVRDIHDAAAWFVGPFKNLCTIHNAKLAMVVNWGLAALVYVIVGGVIASLIARMTPRRRPVAI
jgi:uncharacterized membrane protein YfcA